MNIKLYYVVYSLVFISQCLCKRRIQSASSASLSTDTDTLDVKDYIHPHSKVPRSGFIIGKDISKNNQAVTIRVAKKVNKHGYCEKLTFNNIPQPNYSPFVGPNIFVIDDNAFTNGRYAWTNGHEYLSFVTTNDNGGNWLIGNVPGVDSGYVYIETGGEFNLSPIGFESDSVHWHWLQRGKWIPYPALKVSCIDSIDDENDGMDEQLLPSFHVIEYFDIEQKQSQSSYLIQNFRSKLTNFISQTAYLDISSMKWHILSDVRTEVEFGLPYNIITPTLKDGVIGVLVNQEHGSIISWRLTFRLYHLTNAEKEKASKSTIQHSDEVLIEINNQGFWETNYQVIPMDDAKLTMFKRSIQADLSLIAPGDYVWIWQSNHISFKMDENNNEISKSKPLNEKTYDAVLYCVSRSESTIIFKYFHTERQDTMYQSVLSRDTDLLTMKFSSDESSEQSSSGIPLSIQYKSNALLLKSIFYIGPRPADFIIRYLINKDGSPNQMSSCYMYHAAVSLPNPFVYAAEIICVLLGAKPLTMIQYTTTSDHQWKFPLVQELVRGVISSKLILGDKLPIDYVIFKYKTDESLIIYRKNRKEYVDALVPHNEAQALHPLPYPNREDPTPDYKLQIYNAYWNGYVLGYPEFFIVSYCETFHGPLSLELKRVELSRARRDVQYYFKQNGLSYMPIGFGNDPQISDEHMQAIIKTFQPNNNK
eukprot:gene12335-16544_t